MRPLIPLVLLALSVILPRPSLAQDSPPPASAEQVPPESPDPLQYVRSLMASPDPTERQTGLIAIRHMCAGKAVERCPLTEEIRACLTKDPEESLRLEAIHLVKVMEGPQVLSLLDEAIRAGGKAVRLQAVRVLGVQEDPKASKLLAALVLTDPDPEVRALASALSGFHAPPELAADGGGPPVEKPEAKIYADPNASRVLFSPTALPLPPQAFRAHTLDLGYWEMDYTLNENAALGGVVAVPAGVFALGPRFHLAYAASDIVHLGVHGAAGVAGLLFGDVEDSFTFFANGGPILTIGTSRLFLNINVNLMGAMMTQYGEGAMMVVPNLGGGIQIHRMLKLVLEVHVPIILHEDIDTVVVVPIAYGLRIFNDNIYGDVGFVIPAAEGIWEVLQFFPIGFPMLSFGFNI